MANIEMMVGASVVALLVVLARLCCNLAGCSCPGKLCLTVLYTLAIGSLFFAVFQGALVGVVWVAAAVAVWVILIRSPLDKKWLY